MRTDEMQENGNRTLAERLLLSVVAVQIFAFNIFLIKLNWFLLDKEIIFTDDLAATSLGAFDAQSLSQIYGAPSWNFYFHPGPFLMYWQGAFEIIDRVLGTNIGHVAATYVSHLALLNITIFGVFLAIRKLFKLDVVRAVLFLTAYLSFLIARPSYVIAIMEPYSAALLFGWFTVACAVATRGNWHYLVLAVALGLSCFQQHAAYSYPMILFLLALIPFCFWPFFRASPGSRLRIIAASAATAVIGAIPLIYDLTFEGGHNIGKYLSYASAVAKQPRVPIAQGINLVAENARVPASLFVALIVATLLALGTAGVRWKFQRTDDYPAGEGLSHITLFGALGLVAATLFYTVSASAGYAPPHASIYAYISLAILVASVGVATSDLVLHRGLLPIFLSIIMLPIITFGSTIGSAGVDVFKIPMDPGSIVRAPEMRRLVTSIKEQMKQRTNSFAGIVVTFPLPIDKPSVDQTELPWRMAAGLMNLLRRDQMQYCVPPAPHSEMVYPFGIVALFGKASSCNENSIVLNVGFRCEHGDVLAEFNSSNYVLGRCKS